MSGIVTPTFRVGIAGCTDGFASPRFSVCGGLSSVFPTIFILYLNDLPSEALSSTTSILSL